MPQPLKKMMVFVDGENLLLRFQAMLKKGLTPAGSSQLTHVEDSYVWHNQTIAATYHDIIRATYYTSFTGDDMAVRKAGEDIKRLRFFTPLVREMSCNDGFLFPKVFKKVRQSAKTKAVDINITTDILIHVHNDSIDSVYIVAGDGDYIPVINEAMHCGKQVYLAALSDGLNPALPSAVDHFINLDSCYFSPEKQKKP